MDVVALIGPTGSGKTSTSVSLAKSINANIYSLDSLCVYKGIEIACAKPDKRARMEVNHFGLDLIEPDERTNAHEISKVMTQAHESSKAEGKRLLIVGGSSFYLKAFIQGLSVHPSQVECHDEVLSLAAHEASRLPLREQYSFLRQNDREYARRIHSRDSFRIEKALMIMGSTGLSPSEFFAKYPRTGARPKVVVYSLSVDKQENDRLIRLRTKEMIELGILREAEWLLRDYGRDIYPFKSIGLRECLMHLDGEITKVQLEKLICANTIMLAKRQRTFNRTQFDGVIHIEDIETIRKELG